MDSPLLGSEAAAAALPLGAGVSAVPIMKSFSTPALDFLRALVVSFFLLFLLLERVLGVCWGVAAFISVLAGWKSAGGATMVATQ